jgi:hypothetical protein
MISESRERGGADVSEWMDNRMDNSVVRFEVTPDQLSELG